jgi:hypothetical protein
LYNTKEKTMNHIIDAEPARLAGLLMDMLAKVRAGHITLDHIARFNNLSAEDREMMFRRSLPKDKEPPPEPVLDFIVRVDRSVKPTYPDWMGKVMHPELELAGPAEYNLQTGVEEWLHDNQKRGSVEGNTIYKDLQKGDNLATCLNLQDGLAIQAKGIAVFRKLFAGKAVFLWGSVVRNRNGDLLVPYLCDYGDRVGLLWR